MAWRITGSCERPISRASAPRSTSAPCGPVGAGPSGSSAAASEASVPDASSGRGLGSALRGPRARSPITERS